MRRAALAVAAGLVAAPALGAEGAASHFLPGAGGDMLLAAPQQPGLTVANKGSLAANASANRFYVALGGRSHGERVGRFHGERLALTGFAWA